MYATKTNACTTNNKRARAAPRDVGGGARLRASVRWRGDRPPRLTPRRQGAAASQASSSSPARVDRRQSIVSCSPRSTHPPITSSTTPSPSHSGARAGAQSNQSRATHVEHRQGRQTRGARSPSRPSEDDAHGRPSRRRDQGDARHTTTREDRARRPSTPSDPEPRTPADAAAVGRTRARSASRASS